MKLNQYIDHTLLKADATLIQIETLCLEAKEHHFFSVCVNSYYVREAVSFLHGSSVKVCTVVGFPLGACTTETKLFEARQALKDGAREIDMVVNLSAVKCCNWQYVLDEMFSLAQLCHQHGAILKVILETCLLSDEEKKKVCSLAIAAEVDFVKTSTGFSTGGATVDDVKLMHSIVGDVMGVKASGGVRNIETARAMIAAGATRLGTSASVDIVKELIVAPGGY